MVLVVEGAADVDDVDRGPRAGPAVGRGGREGGAGEDRGALRTTAARRGPGPRRAAPAAARGSARGPRPTPRGLGAQLQDRVERRRPGDRRPSAARVAGAVDLGLVGGDGSQRGQQPRRRRCGRRPRPSDLGPAGPASAPADVARPGRRRAREPARLDRAEQVAGRPGRAGRSGPGRRSGRRPRSSPTVAEIDVLELVGLVDDHDVVLGEDGAARSEVEAVQVGLTTTTSASAAARRGRPRRSTARPAGSLARPGTPRARR